MQGIFHEISRYHFGLPSGYSPQMNRNETSKGFPSSLRAVVTGAGSGLGRAFCLELAKRKSRIIAADINIESAEQTAHLIEQAGGTALSVSADVTKWEDVENLQKRAWGEWQGTDLLVNNAGVAVGGIFEEIDLEDWRWAMDINLWGVIYGCRAFVPQMKKQGFGYILNVASIAGLISPPFMSPYNVSKAGVVALSESLHCELHGDGIHVTALCPSFFKTNIADSGRGPVAFMTKTKSQIRKWMSQSKVQAPGVAKVALDAVEGGHIYALPMEDARLYWRLKRAFPGIYYSKILPGAAKVSELKRRLGRRRK